jgi:phytoene dehydrogenase-like protein
LVDGQVLRSRLVVSNADPKRTFLGLLAEEALDESIIAAVQPLETKCATAKFHAILDELPDFRHDMGAAFDPRYIADVGICPSFTYYRQSLEDALAGRVTNSPIIDIQIPTVYDPTIAPAGKHIASLWVRFLPVQPAEGSWPALREQFGEQLIDLITEYAPNFRRSLIDWLVYTPADIEQRVYMTNGNFRHTDHAPHQLLAHRLFARGGHRTPVAQLYMCGAGTHPGGDVSGAPGYNAAQAILHDLAMR